MNTQFKMGLKNWLKRFLLFNKIPLKSTALFFIFCLFLLISYQNCSPVNFNKNNSQSSSVSSSDSQARNIEFDITADSTSEFVKVFLIIDNSPSMTHSRERLAAGLPNMLNSDKLKNYNIDFYLLTTTQGSELEAFAYTESNFRVTDYLQTYRYSENGVEKVSSMAPPPPNSYTGEAKWSLRQPKIYSLRKGEDTNNVISQLSADIIGLGVSGSEREAGLCTINRVLYETEKNRVVANNDKLAFVIISDEDDSWSNPNGNRELCKIASSGTVNYPIETREVRMNMIGNVKYQTIKVSVEPSESHPEPFQIYGRKFSLGTPVSDMSICTGLPTSCSEADKQSAVQWIGTTIDKVLECQIKCETNFRYQCVLRSYSEGEEKYSCDNGSSTFSDFSTACTNSLGGTPFVNECQEVYVPNNRLLSEQHLCSQTGTCAADNPMQEAIFQKLNSLTSKSNYLIYSIVDTPEDSCSKDSTQAEGSQYIGLTQRAVQEGGRGGYMSICASNYDLALSQLSDYIITVLRTDYAIPNFDPKNEQITKVLLLTTDPNNASNKLELELKIGIDVHIKDNSILLQNNLIKVGDKVRVITRQN